MSIDWFWLTVIVLIVALCTKSALCCYFESKYGEGKPSNKDMDKCQNIKDAKLRKKCPIKPK